MALDVCILNNQLNEAIMFSHFFMGLMEMKYTEIKESVKERLE